MTQKVRLTGVAGRGKFATVDNADYPTVRRYKWHFRDGYAITKHNGKDLRMHRLVAKVRDPSVLVDHKDGDRLNNTRDNLRRYTPTQNANNRCDNRKVFAFGEWKTIAEWAADPICLVSYDVLYGRIRKGVLPQWAILAEAD